MSKIVKFKSPIELPDGLVVEKSRITPQMAVEWLKANRHNRPLSRSHVNFLAGEIEAGHWQLNGQAIVIADTEDVLDGQHRLHAIIEAGKPIETLVVYGITAAAFKTMDTGKIRSGSDALSLAYSNIPDEIRKAAAAAVRYARLIELGFSGEHTRFKISNTDLLEIVAKHPEYWRCAEILAGYPRDARPVPLGMGVALYVKTNEKDPALSQSFMQRFFTGENIERTDAEYILRQLFAKDSQRVSRYPLQTRLKMCVKAWNCVRKKKPATRQSIALGPHDDAKIVML